MKPTYQNGDLIGFQGYHPVSRLIGLGTGGFPFWPLYWGISHIGIIGSYKGEQYLFESTELTDLPCAIKGTRQAGTQAHKLEDRLAVYDGRAWHYPLTAPLYPQESKRLNRFLLDHLGRPYDRLGAFASSDWVMTWIEPSLREDQLAFCYCSEVVEGVFRYIDRWHVADIGQYSPNRLVRVARRKGLIGKRRRIL